MEPSQPSPPPPSGHPRSPSVEGRLSAALDEFAISLLNILTDDSKVGEGDKARDRYDLKTKMDAFKMAQDWLAKRKKLSPDDDNAAPGVEAMKEVVLQIMAEQRVVRVPIPKTGRPNKDEAQARADFRAVSDKAPPPDDNELRRMLEKAK